VASSFSVVDSSKLAKAIDSIGISTRRATDIQLRAKAGELIKLTVEYLLTPEELLVVVAGLSTVVSEKVEVMKGVMMGIVAVDGHEGPAIAIKVNDGDTAVLAIPAAVQIFEMLGDLLYQVGALSDEDDVEEGVMLQ
jgi:hypothetical protein